MSLLNEYKEQEKNRQVVAAQTKQHYNSVNVPGNRVVNVDAEAVRRRIAEMAEARTVPNHD